MKSDTDKSVSEYYTAMPAWRRDLVLLWNFAKISALVLGGGYAIIAAAREEFCTRRHWITEEEFPDLIAVTQTVPGILAANFAVAVGWKTGRWRGAICALAGAVLPPLLIMTAIAAVMTKLTPYLDTPAVRGAFKGAIAAVTAMVLATAIKLCKSTVHRWFDVAVAAGCFIGLAVFHVNPALLILGAIAAGMIKIYGFPGGRRPTETNK